MVDAGYTVTPYNTANRVPGAYTDPNMRNILAGIFNPSHWEDSLDFLLYRELQTPAAPAPVQVGLITDLSAEITPASGPYSLLERVGPGDADGQFDEPRGIAMASDESVYVVDSNNARVERFDPEGNFVASWDGASGSVALTISARGYGPTGIAVGNDDLFYVADTWGHRIVVLDSSGTVIRTWGTFADNQDAPSAELNPGAFFGPRAVAVTDDEVFVVDTGNERVEVFGKDGSFKRAFGGKGSAASQLIEPVGIAIGPDGNVYVADSGNARISVFTKSGEPIAQWPVVAWSGRSGYEPYLAFGADGILYATSSATGSVEVIGKDGQLLGSITTSGTQSLKRPVGIALESDGTLLVSDIGSSAVYRIEPLTVENIDDVAIGAVAATPEPTSASNLLPPASPAASPSASPIATPRP
jgi:sugar lactone lactonase YvrE